MDKETLWTDFLQVIKNKLMSVSYDTWFKDTKLYKVESDKLYIEVPMEFHKTYLSSTYYDLIEEIITDLTGSTYSLEFLVKEEIEEKVATIKVEDEKKDISKDNSNLKP